MSDVMRMIDANANRAREAMRVMEDAARFLLDDARLSEALKQLRHDFSVAMSMWSDLVLSRDTPHDVGTSISTPSESSRSDEREVVVAAGKRLSEALRVIEEYAKTKKEFQESSQTIEKLRYLGYELERQLVEAMGAIRRRQWHVCVLVTQSLCTRRAWRDVVQAILEVGREASDPKALCIQLREKELEGGELLDRAGWLVSQSKQAGVDVVINDRPDIAKLVQADGVHLGQSDLPVREARRIVGFKCMIGVSTSNLDEAKDALRDGADYCGVGPMFATTTKDKPVLAGPQYLREYMQWDKLPHLAIGGINPSNLRELVAEGVRGVAVSSCVCSAESPGEVVQALLDGVSNEH